MNLYGFPIEEFEAVHSADGHRMYLQRGPLILEAASHGWKRVENLPTWQTEPPTEAGWYWIIGDHGRMEAYEVPMFEAQDGNLKYNNPVTVRKVLLWWPIPITMPPAPEGV